MRIPRTTTRLPGRRDVLRRGALLAALAAWIPLAGAGAQTTVALIDVTAAVGIDFRAAYGTAARPYVTDSGGAGGAWVDYDRDGRVDLALANGLAGPSDQPYAATRAALAGTPLPASRRADGTLPRNALYRNEGSSFTSVGERAGFADSAWANAIVAGDVDNDGFVDLVVTAIGPNVAYRNNGDGTFSRWTLGVEDARWSTGATFLDWDDDGDLDLYIANYVDFDASTTATLGDGVCNYLGIEVFCGPMGLAGSRDGLYENQGDHFTPWHEADVDPESTFGFAVLAFDCDARPGQEIYVANDSNINLLYRRNDDAVEDLSLFSGAGFSGAGREQAGMGIAAGDVDGDGDLDLLVSNFQQDYNTLYANLGDCVFEDVSTRVGLAADSYPYMAWSSLLLDLDGDADLDAFVANGHLYPQLGERGLEEFGQPNLLFLNQLRESGALAFQTAPASAGLAVAESSRAAAYADFDNDEDLDLLVTRIDGPPLLLRNDTSMRHPALRLTLVGRQGNRDAYGTQVRVVAGGVTQLRELRAGDGYLANNDTRLLLHLPGGRAASVEITWPGGDVTTLRDVAPGSLVVDQQRGVIAREES
jgi:hypothetical protein